MKPLTQPLTLNEIAKAIQREQKYTIRHAYRLAGEVVAELAVLEAKEKKVEREPPAQEWGDYLQRQVLWEE